MMNSKTRLIILIASLIIWTVVLIYDIKENAHVLMIVADVFVVVFIVVLCFSSPGLPSAPEVKSVQQVEDEIVQIEMRQKSA